MSAAAEPPYLPNELSRTLTYESVNRDADLAIYSVMETKCIPELTGSSSALGPPVHIDSGICQIGNEINLDGVSHFVEEKEVSGCDWENLLFDEGNLSIFESPIDSKSLNDPSQKLLEPGMSCGTSLLNSLHKSIAVDTCQLSETDDPSFQHKENNMNEIDENRDLLVSLSNCEAEDANEIVDAEVQFEVHLLPS